MNGSRPKWCFVAAAAALGAVGMFAAAAAEVKPADEARRPEFTAAQLEFFEQQVRPILTAKCLKCHGGEAKVQSEFYLTSRAATIRGGELGPAVDLTKLADSQLLQAIRYEGLEMPPSGKLSKDEVAVLTRWVNEGLPWPAHLEKEPPHVAEKKRAVTDEDRRYWAYQPIVEPTVPQVKNSARVRTPIDAFILAKLEAAGIEPAPEADPRELIRRATYDLTGLPPTPEEVGEFVEAARDQRSRLYEEVYAKLVDKLLASPHYGEKWGRHWLDLVRYAETHGYERDSAKPFAWRYRDYVIDSLNRDKPYDQFLREQLAGDELPVVTPETLTATGFYRLGIWDDEPADRDLAHYDVLDGVTSTTAGVVLGMSVGCARCHDHKRDPILQRDYYKLLAFFHDVTDMGRENLRRIATPAEQAEYERQVAAKRQNEAEWYAQIYALEQKFLAEAGAHGVKLGNAQGADLADLQYRLYRDTWNELPDFDALKPEATGTAASRLISLGLASRGEAIGLVFEGKLQVPRAGEYVFQASAREGVRVIVNGVRVVDRPQRGLHSAEGRIDLPAGLLPFRLEYYNAAQSPKLSLSWSGPGFDRRRLSDDALPAARDDAETWAYVTQLSDKSWMRPEYDDSAWQRGKAGFGTPGTPGAKVGTVWNTKNIYMRRKFTLAAVPEKLALDLHHDEDVTIFLNGKKAYAAEGFLTKYERIELSGEATAALKPGENVIGVYCKQSVGGQYIDVRLADADQTLEELIRRHGVAVLGQADADRYLRLVEQFNAGRRKTVAAPGTDVMCVVERGNRPTHVLLRGLPQAQGELVDAGVPEVLTPAGYVFATAKTQANNLGETSGKRLALAEWMVDAKNPLTARVMANRLWQFHFGRGLSATSNDFGKLGELPTHPELLDWLATDLVRGEWRLKRMHKQIMLSSAYRMSSRANDAGLRLDPANTLVWRANMRRLTAEEVRDSILAVGGKLDLRVGGPSVYPPIPQEVLAGQSRPGEGWPTSPPEDASRRSVYVHVKRSLQLPIMAAHDQADTDGSCAVRYTTTVPTQSLGLLNGEFMHEQAAAMAARLERERPGEIERKIRRAIELIAQRPASNEEIARDAAFIRDAQVKDQLSPADALKLYCLLMLNTNEFFYIE